jgi:hypothetical protein
LPDSVIPLHVFSCSAMKEEYDKVALIVEFEKVFLNL